MAFNFNKFFINRLNFTGCVYNESTKVSLLGQRLDELENEMKATSTRNEKVRKCRKRRLLLFFVLVFLPQTAFVCILCVQVREECLNAFDEAQRKLVEDYRQKRHEVLSAITELSQQLQGVCVCVCVSRKRCQCALCVLAENVVNVHCAC